jgi:hypothetical protein
MKKCELIQHYLRSILDYFLVLNTKLLYLINFCYTFDLESVSGEESEESLESPSTPLAPPPSFAPPKPAYLTPHQVFIIQPTPEIESKPSLGEEEEDNGSEIDETIIIANEDSRIPEDVESNASAIYPEFILEKPTRKSNEGIVYFS